MGVRNCADIGENLQKIISRLMDNQNLLKYLYYSDKDPLSHPDLTDEQINEIIEYDKKKKAEDYKRKLKAEKARQEKQKKEIEEKEYEQYLRLKKKFETE